MPAAVGVSRGTCRCATEFSDDVHGSETVFRGNAGAHVRIIGGHTIGVRYAASTADTRCGRFPDKRFSEGTVTIAYSFLGANQFAAVKWQ